MFASEFRTAVVAAVGATLMSAVVACAPGASTASPSGPAGDHDAFKQCMTANGVPAPSEGGPGGRGGSGPGWSWWPGRPATRGPRRMVQPRLTPRCRPQGPAVRRPTATHRPRRPVSTSRRGTTPRRHAHRWRPRRLSGRDDPGLMRWLERRSVFRRPPAPHPSGTAQLEFGHGRLDLRDPCPIETPGTLHTNTLVEGPQDALFTRIRDQ